MGWQNRTTADDPEDGGFEPRTAKTAAGEDWLNTNFFGEKAIAPAKRRRAPSPIPDARLLFQVQDDIMKTLNALKKLPKDMGDEDSDYSKAVKSAQTQAENGYKLINRYLRTYVNNDPN